jgi:hypothetical protein
MKQEVAKKMNIHAEVSTSKLRKIDPNLAAARAIKVPQPKAEVVNRLLRKTFS